MAGRGFFLMALSVFLADISCRADETAKPEAITFEAHVLPIIKTRCVRCHAGAEPQAGLRLLTRVEILKGGKSGPAIRLNAAESSLLWEKISSNQMPEGGPPLSAKEKGIFRTWINDGAASTDGTPIEVSQENRPDSDGPSDFWAFQPPKRPMVPDQTHNNSVLNPLDAFLAFRLETAGLRFSPEADPATLLRRVTFDLTGLPPTPEELNDFLANNSPQAYEQLVERLLASPRYGERWGRHWLDLAGYADSAGILSEDRPLPTMYRYRDYVIRSLNLDKPYDRFLQEQIAGDELSDYWAAHDSLERLPENVIEAITATGFLRCAADSSRPDFSTIKNADALYFYPTINDTLQIVSSATMGLTLQCARCHSHKYDPIPQTDYYRLQAIFMSAFRPQQWVPQMERKIPVATAAEKKVATEHNGRIDAEVVRLRSELDTLRKDHMQKWFDQQLSMLPEAIRNDVRVAIEKPVDQRTLVEVYLAEKFQSQLRPADNKVANVLSDAFPEYKKGLAEGNARIAEKERQRIVFDEIRAAYDLPGPVTTPVLKRGDALTPGPPVEPGVMTALRTSKPFDWSPPPEGAKTSGRRLAFAKWLTQSDHPLTARVMVNRVWRQHFGEGLVSTPEDFGNLGSPPSHPELLDWLACEFVRNEWSIKRLHRLILSSHAYRQQSVIHEAEHGKGMDLDPGNRWLWRQRFRRLEAEPIRDSLLMVAGRLDSRLYGAPAPMARQPDGSVLAMADGERRRSIYLQILRLNPLDSLQSFDQPVMEINCTQRRFSTVSTQALLMLNSDTIGNVALAFADRLLSESPNDIVRRAMELAFSRRTQDQEVVELESFLTSQQHRYALSGQTHDAARRMAVADLCQMLFAANEFVYVD